MKLHREKLIEEAWTAFCNAPTGRDCGRSKVIAAVDAVVSEVEAQHQQPSAPAELPMTPKEIKRWMQACTHEPARQVLRHYLELMDAGSGVEGGS